MLVHVCELCKALLKFIAFTELVAAFNVSVLQNFPLDASLIYLWSDYILGMLISDLWLSLKGLNWMYLFLTVVVN